MQLYKIDIAAVRGLKRLITPLLAGLLANETDQALSFEAFFTTVQQIVSNKIICVFYAATCSFLHIYLPANSRYKERDASGALPYSASF